MKCEACGGDGLIEVGAYRGDEDDPNTRECRLCGGVVALETRRLAQQVATEDWETVSFKDEHGQMRTLHEVGSADHAAQQLKQLAHVSSESGARIKDFVLTLNTSAVQPPPSRSQTPQDVAREYAQRLNEQNKRQQQDAERMRRQATDALRMVKIRRLKLTATCWYRSPDDDENTLRHCRGIESQELTGSWVKFKPAEDDEQVTHVKICAAQQSGACLIPLSSSRSVQFGDALQVVFTEPELETIISTFVK